MGMNPEMGMADENGMMDAQPMMGGMDDVAWCYQREGRLRHIQNLMTYVTHNVLFKEFKQIYNKNDFCFLTKINFTKIDKSNETI